MEKSPYLPILIELKSYYDAQDLTLLIRNKLRADFLRDVSAEAIWNNIDRGQFAFLLDGFDEMADRSGEQYRLSLFEKLLPILGSPCPVILTSRPGLFVAKGEIEHLVTRWENESIPLRVTPRPPNKKASERYGKVEDLKNTLLQSFNASNQVPARVSMPSDDTLSVVVLSPFGTDKISEFVAHRIATVHAESGNDSSCNVDDVLAFIERVYDLSDLASRPLLLKMIVDTILRGGIDISDPTVEFGPSGIYEIYTTLKLELDWKKGRVRRGGLSQEKRREFAEAMAVAMHKKSTLSVDLSFVLSQLPQEAVSSNGVELSGEEIATDFMTCSFLTIDEKQVCSFAHKSFMEFFLARNIKEFLAARNPLLRDKLPTAVLYFVGGFAPTERNVADRLWKLLIDSSPDQTLLRRNLLAAYLFTATSHVSRRIKDAELFDVRYGDLTLERFQFRDVKISTVEARRLILVAARSKALRLYRCLIEDWLISRSRLIVEVDACEFGNISFEEGSIITSLHETFAQTVNVNKSTGTLAISDSKIGELSLDKSRASFVLLRTKIDKLRASNSDISLSGEAHYAGNVLSSAKVRGSFLRSAFSNPMLRQIFLKIASSPVNQESVHDHGQCTLPRSDISTGSCVFGSGHSLKSTDIERCNFGLVGFEYNDNVAGLHNFRGWGVLIVTARASGLLSDQPYKAVTRRLILCTRDWYSEAHSKSGRLSSLFEFVNGDQVQSSLADDFIANALRRCRLQIGDLASKVD